MYDVIGDCCGLYGPRISPDVNGKKFRTPSPQQEPSVTLPTQRQKVVVSEARVNQGTDSGGCCSNNFLKGVFSGFTKMIFHQQTCLSVKNGDLKKWRWKSTISRFVLGWETNGWSIIHF